MKKHPKLFISTDIETDGPHIGKNSMRSFASEALCPTTLKVISRFSINLKPLPHASENHQTVEVFFKGQFPNAWADLNQNPQDPAVAMKKYLFWLDSLNSDDLWFVAAPISFDKSWVNWYLKEFCWNNMSGAIKTPFNFRDFDILSWECGLLGADPSEHDILIYPDEWASPLPHTHIAREDVAKATDELIRRFKWLNQRLNQYTKLL